MSSSVPLGQDTIDVAGTNTGYYELAGADEIRAYFAQVMHRRFLPGGRVRCVIEDGRFTRVFLLPEESLRDALGSVNAEIEEEQAAGGN